MRKRQNNINGCKHRFNETRTHKKQGKEEITILRNRCFLRLNGKYMDKKCIFPKLTHKNCYVALKRDI